MPLDTSFFKEKLLEEKARLENELATIAHKENGTENWEAKGTITDQSIDADPNEVADKLEEFETNQAIVDRLKEELSNINTALLKVEKDSYGICEVGGEEIEEDRLNANPAALTCKAHINN
jgi:RNA polymerase-binding transcription factor DksA